MKLLAGICQTYSIEEVLLVWIEMEGPATLF
jgi:hypothetical protein